MNKLLQHLILFTLLGISSSSAFAQCPSNPLSITSQADIDNFATNWPSCTQLGDVTISGPSITSLTGLAQITSFTGDVTIAGTSLQNLTGLNMVTEIGGTLNIVSNLQLNKLNALASLVTVSGDLDIVANYQLTNLAGLQGITSLTNNLEIRNNDGLQNLNGLNNLVSVDGTLLLDFNQNLTTLSALSGLQSVGSLSLVDLPSITSLIGIENIDTLTILSLESLPISSVSETQNVQSLDYLIITDSPISSISLPNVTQLDIGLQLNGTMFTNLDDFSHMTQIGATNAFGVSYFALLNNSMLSDISGVQNADLSELQQLFIEDNVQLSHCSILSVCGILDPQSPNLTTVSIQNNAPSGSCNSQQDVIDACTVLFGDDDMDSVQNYLDNCPNTPNTDQADQDNDGIGDVCDDSDMDGTLDSDDNCPNAANVDQNNMDGDDFGDICDNCVTVPNNDQVDSNNDGIGDACATEAGENTGGVGVGNEDPQSKLHITEGDVYIDNIYRGIIMKTQGGKCFRYRPNENGDLEATEIDCP